ncbi:hypothetical protein FOL47_008160 [Perkinsus chesapeaki]|uniref:diacylglycerol O-acyltransferase n=1 Tax=Perkinsus chesapeaki TaxID=330153 RepID=A0A7J6MUB1_PERCH|nr:hypothetical protein FOL47_008160 [Perkinsus chesapeaki]
MALQQQLLAIILLFTPAALRGSRSYLSWFVGALLSYSIYFFDGSEYKPHSRFWPEFLQAGRRLNAAIMRRLFQRVSFILEDEEAVNSLPKVVYCAHPHGVVPFIHPFLICNVKHKLCPLGARVLFKLPLMRELCLWYGAIDANKKTALEALKQDFSVSIVIGGTREQMIPFSPTHDTIVCKTRMGYARLAYEAGRVPIVPAYCFGQSIAHDTGHFMLAFRQRIQRLIGVALPFPKSILPKYLKDFALVVGKPLMWEETDTPDTMHKKYVAAVDDLFYRYRGRFPEYKDRELSKI